MSVTSQSFEPASPPALRAGMRPARTTDDLPLPDGPTTATRGWVPDGLEQIVDEDLAPVEIEGIGFGEGAQPLVGVAYGGHSPPSVRSRLSLPRRCRRLGAPHAESLPPSRSGWRAGRPWPAQHLVEFGGQPGAGIATDGKGDGPPGTPR